MEKLLSIPPREQSGADSQNRFEYQVSSIVSHLIQKYKNNEEVMVYCEFHDDFSELKK
ncbi:dsDNA nuclease domain-containing protein [Enterococcus sp. DIV0213h]